MCVCIYIYTMYVELYIYTHILCMYVYIYIYIRILVYKYIYVRVYVQTIKHVGIPDCFTFHSAPARTASHSAAVAHNAPPHHPPATGKWSFLSP